MKFLMVDDEPAALNVLVRAVKEAQPDAEIHSFTFSAEAMEDMIEDHFHPDVAFLDIRMPETSGLEMARRIREESPRTNVIFVTAFADYALDAMSLRSSGYLIKPVSADQVQRELDDLRYPVKRSEPAGKIRIQCFGSFEVFADEKPLAFHYQKSKELLAYLVDRRGAACNTLELCSVLWEDRQDEDENYRAYLRKLISDLSHVLEDAGEERIFLKRRNSFAIAVDLVDCDYYRFLRQETAAVNLYCGEYMTQYSWAEMTLGGLERKEDHGDQPCNGCDQGNSGWNHRQ